MDGFITILFLCLLLEYKIVYNFAYKKGKNDINLNLKKEGYEIGKNEIREDFHKLLKLPDEDFYESIEKIRKKIIDEDKSETE